MNDDARDEHLEKNVEGKVLLDRNGNVYSKKKVESVIRNVRYNLTTDKEYHYREVLMLYKPWRKESDIIGDCETFQERFIEVMSDDPDLELKMSEYNHSADAIEKAIESLKEIDENELEEAWDKCAPNTQCQNRQDEEEGSKTSDIYPSFLPSEDSTLKHSDITSERGCQTENETDIIMNMMKDEDYNALLRSLNQKQRECFVHVMKSVKTSSDPFHFFLTGGAGVGKTAVVTAIYQMAIRYYNKGAGINPDDLKVLLGAPTGKAAYLIHGYTLHTLFSFPASQGFTYKPLSCDKKNSLQAKFKHVKLIIIDEISMVGNQMFSFIHQRLQQIMDSYLQFGGLSVIAVGDLYQLKPVFDGWIFENLSHDYGPLAVNLWQDNFKMFCLTEIMRQKDDCHYAELLNRLREGKHTKEDIETLSTRLINIDPHHQDYPMYTSHIFLKNELVNTYNKQIYDNSPTCKRISISAWDVVVGDVTKDVKGKIRNAIPTDCSKTMGLLKTLQTAISSRIELSTNVNVEDGLANGSSGTVMAVQVHSKTNKAEFIWILFDRKEMGKNTREMNKHLFKKGIHQSWTPISQIKRQFKVGKYKSAEVLRCQFPIRPATAKTAHRCQGDTMESAVKNFQGRSFPHVHYVALSRVKSLNKLYLKNLKESSISVSHKVELEMDRLQKHCQLQTTVMSKAKNGDFSIVFQNVRSLSKHVCDIKCDPFYTNSDMMIFVETN